MKDIIKIIAFIRVYQEPIYGKRYFNLDHGKYNLESYFLPRGFTKTRLKKVLKIMLEDGMISKEKGDKTPNLYSLSIFTKIS